MRTATVLVGLCLFASTGAFAQSSNKSDPLSSLPPRDSVKLSQVIAKAEVRPGFFAIKTVSFSAGQYEVVYFMDDGAEVRINFDAKTGEARPPKTGGLFGN
ncbi:PepSY domain-containing protein [Chenggangzhangella methanolivorans]|uniref:PepSY domain-containing protein n=1 Tax=Chenggangzhangella methanolivorans TaxID=1437009 RepID=A0A9E6URJ7_9HYPH|nr:PepSY domain-containing protein [Chenggangzhangella methanolivorans]QZO02360.1 PepSY domain-containing protein [Chenggangzhangella methanolivorans]